jgi:hypothetical protein
VGHPVPLVWIGHYGGRCYEKGRCERAREDGFVGLHAESRGVTRCAVAVVDLELQVSE